MHNRTPLNIFNYFELSVYTVLFLIFVLSILGWLVSAIRFDGNFYDILATLVPLVMFGELICGPIRRRVKKLIFNKKDNPLKKSSNLLWWFYLFTIGVFGIANGNYGETVLIILGLLFVMFVVPNIVSDKAEKIVEKAYKKQENNKKNNEKKDKEEYGWQYWD